MAGVAAFSCGLLGCGSALCWLLLVLVLVLVAAVVVARLGCSGVAWGGAWGFGEG